ncbi:bifunctional acetaldehyde-CoA/alcohol dehydrogenase [Lactobacillus helveticus]|uniref:bifunctional acetaldehyde-CoA/alcohol dehydrogenase n=1 Tax=Lactobacillus helveticus TaxID=1587 RepID=UPI00081A689A|nr:bifunctional acetaldehyde-CoA/alcohol dehydrogenase [Lactobacillus helveticus]ANZ56536.1 bifunctional acetaldehyde-CoA/alcohol dehydrogenase [Lactobacillus helveticus]AQY52979.1 bifunctional acetaldehyde-CoA/alcohol dehydrogenase [Lactobacillus helveticus]MBU6034553.1 bifunctional acetaldehyde-CoA/alcohol dehydrogenase [Lactobacillus helveticus]MBW1220261.1 bifunctional acetaldehyde-CoA/alcohol dehydrogenase [Lactobacillus helveticus]MDY0875637.1 bifunctional acetaldehyde-CoA/alcohol dehydr
MAKTQPKETQTEKEKKKQIYDMVDNLVKRSHVALDEMANFTQEQVDKICEAVATAGEQNAYPLAKMAVEETKRGVVEDKTTKNMYASENIWNSLRHEKTVGVIEEDKELGLTKIAEPKGVIAGVTPVTNPTSTVIFKAMLALKTRNTIIFGFHPQAQKCCVETGKIIQAAAVAAGAPRDAIQWIEEPSLDATTDLMNNPGVQTILATGGPGMVKAAYSSGKPAIGVGPGNGPSYIEKTANIDRAVYDIVLSKNFDNGMVCASENSVVVDDEIYDQVKEEFKKWSCYFLNKEEIKKFEERFIDPRRGTVAGPVAGKSAYEIAKLCGVDVPKETKVIVAEYKGVGRKFPLSAEKLSPVFTLYRAKDHDDAFRICSELLDYGGRGHTAGLHSSDQKVIKEFSMKMDACRILVNSPAALGGIGDLYNNMLPSLTLGTGSYGANTFSHNIGARDLLNIKTVAKRRDNMQWVKVPSKTYFEHNAANYLRHMPNVNRFFIVTDEGVADQGFADEITDIISKRRGQKEYEVFKAVTLDPSTDVIKDGVHRMNIFKPDVVIAIGSGSVMNAAKVMRLFYENPEMKFEEAYQKFLDIRKRVVRFPKINGVQLVCIPTTSGTGSEVSPIAVISDAKTGIKHTLCDYALTPDVSIVDDQFVQDLPKRLIAWSGFEALSHAIESYVSTMATDFTRGWSLEAVKIIFANLKKSYDGDLDARKKMHDAATIAGMAYSNAFLGLEHSIAHTVGSTFDIPSGVSDAIALPQVICFNAKRPEKLAMWPHYSVYRADKDYAEIARAIGLTGSSDAELIEELVQKIIDLAQSVGIKMAYKDYGVDENEFNKKVDQLAVEAYGDQNTVTNPVAPLISQIAQLMRDSFEGKDIKTK